MHFDPGGDPGASSVVNGFPTAATPPPDAAAPTAHAGPRLSQSRPAIHHHRRTRRLGFFVGGVVSFFFAVFPLSVLSFSTGGWGRGVGGGGASNIWPFLLPAITRKRLFSFLKDRI